MKKFLLKIAFVFPFFVVLGIFNYVIDEQMIFHKEKLEQAVDWLQQEDTVFGVSHVHKPYLQFMYSQKLDQAKDVLVIGASDCAQLGENIFKGMDVFSHWAPGSGLYFQLAILNEYEKCNKLPKHVVLALRPNVISNKDPRPMDAIAEPYFEILDKLELKEPALDFATVTILKDKFQELFSAKYLVYNLKSESHAIGVAKTLDERFIMFPDGTVKNNFVLQKQIPEKTVLETIDFYTESIQSPSSDLIVLHKRIIEFLQQKGVKVSFFILPFHPRMMADESFKRLNVKWQKYIADLREEYDVELFGGINPIDFDFTEADFIDVSHVKRSSMWKLFPNSKKQNPLN